MSRSGTTPFNYAVPSGTAAVSGQIISSVSYNGFLTDLVNNALNAAWPITYGGTGTTDGSALVPNGSVSVPSVRFQSETNTGFYRVSAGVIGVSILGVNVGTFTATGQTSTLPISITGSTVGFTPFQGISTEAAAAAGPIFEAYRNSASPAANDLIGQLVFYGKDSAANKQEYAEITGFIFSPTSTAEAGGLRFSTVQSGTVGNRMFLNNGLYMSGATGGDQGANSINASSYFIDGAAFGRPVAGTSVAATSGTSVTLASVYPSYASICRLYLDSVSTNGTSAKLIQIGTGGGITTSGYVGSGSYVGTSGGVAAANGAVSTAGLLMNSVVAADNLSGVVEISLHDSVSHRYQITFTGSAGTSFTFTSSSIVTLAGVMDSIRITTVGGTDAFDGSGAVRPYVIA